MSDYNPFMPSQDVAPPPAQDASATQFNPFIARNTGGDPVPTPPVAPPPVPAAASPQSVAPVPAAPEVQDKPAVQSFGELGAGDKTPEMQRVILTGLAQGVVSAGMDINQLAADIGAKLGVIKQDSADSMRSNYDSEREQYKNISYNKDHPIISDLVNQNASFAAKALAGGPLVKGLGLAGSLAKNLAGDAVTGAIAGYTQDPGKVANPFTTRAINGLEQGAISGAASAPFRYLGSLRGAPTAERIAAQQANAEALKPVGGGTVGQVIGDTNGILGQNLQGTEAKAASIPIAGGKAGLLEQQQALRTTQQSFVKSTQPNPADIAALTPQEVADATKAGQSLTDTAIDKAYSSIRGATGKTGPVDMDNVVDTASTLAGKINNQISTTPGEKIVLAKIGDIQSSSTGKTFDQLWDLRRALDGAAFTEAGVLKPSIAATKSMSTLRDAVSEALQAHADASGVGPQWSQIAGQYAQNIAYKKLQDIITTSYSPLGRGGISPGRGMLTFARNLQAKAPQLLPSLTPDQQNAYRGIIKVTQMVSKNLRQVKPGIDVLSTSLSAGLGGLAAHAMGGHVLIGAGVLTHGLTHLLNSNAGRQLLTYAGKQPLRSLKLQTVAMRLMQGLVSATTSGVTKQVAAGIANQ